MTDRTGGTHPPHATRRGTHDAYEAYLQRVGRADLPVEHARDMILDAAARLGLAGVDPLAVANGTAEAQAIAAITAVLDLPPPQAPLAMPPQDLGWKTPSLASPMRAWRRLGARAR